MKIITSLLAAAALLAGITIATAQTLPTNPPTPQEGGAPPPSDFQVVREGTGPCRVVETRPTETKTIVVGNKVYKTREEAQKEITTVCK